MENSLLQMELLEIKSGQHCPQKVQGAITYISNFEAHGWALDPASLDVSFIVEAKLNGKTVGYAIANQLYESLLYSGRSHGKYGFKMLFFQPIDGNERPEFYIVNAGYSFILPYMATFESGAKAPVKISFTELGLDHLVGKLAFFDRIDGKVQISVLQGNDLLGESDAAYSLESGKEFYVFNVKFRNSASEGSSITVRLNYGNTSIDTLTLLLQKKNEDTISPQGKTHKNSLKNVKNSDFNHIILEKQRPKKDHIKSSFIEGDGYFMEAVIDKVSNNILQGKVLLDYKSKINPIVEVSINDKIVGVAVTSIDSSTSRRTKYKTYHFIFYFNPILSSGDQIGCHIIDIEKEKQLSPFVYKEQPDQNSLLSKLNIKGDIEEISSNGAKGWVYSSEFFESSLLVEASVNDVIIGRTIADVFREDLREHGIQNGKYGFHIQFDRPIKKKESVKFCVYLLPVTEFISKEL